MPNPNECINCGLLRTTCEMKDGGEWVKNCQKVSGKTHEFGIPPTGERADRLCGKMITTSNSLHEETYCTNIRPCVLHKIA